MVMVFGLTGFAHAYGMMGNYYGATVSPTASPDQDTAAGQAIWNQLQSGQLKCTQLSNDDFDKLGDYYQSLMMGPSSSYMDQFMTNSFGPNGERQMNIVMGERLSGCNTSAVYPNEGYGYVPMMQMMFGGGFGGMMNGYTNYGYGYSSPISWVTMILIWVILILVIIGLIRWISRK